MSQIIQWMRNVSFKKKLVFLYLFFILLPAFLLTYSYYKNASSIIEEEVTSTMLQAIKQIEINLSTKLDSMEGISNILFMNPTVHTYLGYNSQNDVLGKQIDEARELGKIVTSIEGGKDVFKLRFYVDASKWYAREMINFFPLDQIKGEEWYNNIIDNNGKIIWLKTHAENYLGSGQHQVISCARMIRSLETFDKLAGILIIDILESNLYDMISKVNITKDRRIYIIDSDGYVLSSAVKTQLGEKLFDEEVIAGIRPSAEGIYKMNRNKTFVLHCNIEKTGWKLVALADAGEVSGKILRFSNVSGLLVVVTTLIVFILGVFLLESFLTEKTIYKAQVKEREAQLIALQAQINPHFLYNTLETINWMAIRKNADDISTMIDALAKYFRLSLSKGMDFVTISDEIDLARVYFDIQKKRFDEPFQVSYAVQEEALQCYIPKLILQPIVENALIHGILKRKDAKGRIEIRSRMLAEDILLSVQDNGFGMKREELDRLMNKDALQKTGKSYGIYNVRERIKLYYGEDCGLNITSEEGRGTTVEIKIKIVKTLEKYKKS